MTRRPNSRSGPAGCAFEDAFFRHRETAEELRAECERWRRQALAVADRLLEQSGEPQPNGDAASGTSEAGTSETGASEASAVPEQPGLKQLLEVLLLTRDAINEQIEGASLLMTEAARRGEAEAACRSRRHAALQLRNKRELWKQRALLVAGWIKNAE